jgi:hypothetical protein
MFINTDRNTTRRRFIRLLGNVSILLLPMLTSCTSTRKHHVISPQVPGSDPRHRWLVIAARAPSSHNMQPWKVDLTSRPDKMALYVDTRYLLPASDPESRQTIVSLGGFIELLCMAANADGFHCEVKQPEHNDDESQPVALFTFIRMQTPPTPDGLLAFASLRHTSRAAFHQDKPISEARLSLLLAAGTVPGTVAYGNVQVGKIADINKLVVKAWLAELQRPETMLEMLKVTRIGSQEIEHYRDGIAIQGFLPELAARLGMFPRDHLPAKDSVVMNRMREMGQQQANSSAGWIWLVTTGNSRSQQISAGRAFIRLHLRATQLGIALHPMSQALEHYPEMSESQQHLYQTLNISSEEQTVQILARIGYADHEPLTPRRDLSDFVI